MAGFQTILISCAIAGAAVTYGAYRLSGRKSDRAELLNEICEERESLCRVMAALPEQLELAKRSMIGSAETAGRSTSDASDRWLHEFETDLADAKTMESQLPPAEVTDADRSGMALDLRLAEILALSIRANRLVDKYSHLEIDHAEDERTLEQPSLLTEPPRARQPSLSAVAP